MNNLTLYIIVRYLPRTMNPGKGMAQVSHAGTHLVSKYGKGKEVIEYLAQANGFGTSIVLQSQESDGWERTKHLVKRANKLGYIADIIKDPSYPIDFNLTIPLETVAYLLLPSVRNSEIDRLIKEDYTLHP